MTDKEKALREVEELSSILHDIYQKEAHRQEQLGIGMARHYDEYEKLSEPVKEFDRVLARYILSRMEEQRKEMVGMAQVNFLTSMPVKTSSLIPKGEIWISKDDSATLTALSGNTTEA